MANFRVSITRTQVQTETFVVSCSSLVEITNLLKELENDCAFGKIDDIFDGSEVESVGYEVVGIVPTTDSFFSDRLQKLLDE